MKEQDCTQTVVQARIMAKIGAKKDYSTESDSDKTVTILPSAPPSPYVSLGQNSTRLIRIQEAKNDNDPLVCELFEVAFSAKPKFEALSYMWGEGPAECSIVMNSMDFSVRHNLMDALRYLRKHTSGTLYWIDALCINQQDAAERNSQVRIMRHIYFRATTVVVWLGKRYADYEAVLPDLHALGHFNPPTEQLKPDSTSNRTQKDSPTQLSEKAQQRRMAEELYNDGYWNRLWIVQEIGLANDIKVCFGNSAVEWTQFLHFISMHSIGNCGPVKLHRQRQDRYNGSSTLLQLLQHHKDAVYQDRKDKVYGLIGLASDASGFIIDYERSTLQIWTDVMEFLNHGGLFNSNDIVETGHLVMFLLMGTESAPLQQILRPWAPGEGDKEIITDTNHRRAFELEAAILGCVKHVGPRPQEIVGTLRQVDQWTQQVQSNYQCDLGKAHRESDTLIRTILELDETDMSAICFDSRSTVQWSSRLNTLDLGFYHHSIQNFQSNSGILGENDDSSVQKATNNLRLFQMASSGWNTPWRMGLAPSEVRTGDLICWLRWPRRAIVVRALNFDSLMTWKMQVVGSAVVAEDLGQVRAAQRADWSKRKPALKVFLDAHTIFTLLA
ncbi:heterokaryon incompatibility protein-domain-containing protein [Dactylonectria estremocensis]|uniref:Heterokaryon incompatibility protein-domain-containing protein n=1 Tax=Dactylonectria estremocensis TaxID=1079267 RepID=A0A9P9ETH1_9HYPO|nr:heterokaryon incompatibility protein-domain-containing protein [Dactylonectria estremocensis]